MFGSKVRIVRIIRRFGSRWVIVIVVVLVRKMENGEKGGMKFLQYTDIY